MKSTDIGFSIMIIVLFALLISYSIISSKFVLVEKNWQQYRCNPLIMPFVSIVGHNSAQNFMDCIKTIQMGYMGEMLEPVNKNMIIIGNIGQELAGAVQSSRAFIYKLRKLISDIIINIYSVAENLLIEIMRSLILIKGIAVKMTSILTAISTMDQKS